MSSVFCVCPLPLLAETHSALLLFLLCAYADTPGLAENIGDRTNWYGIHDANCAFFVPTKPNA
jgi:hypothetical protein